MQAFLEKNPCWIITEGIAGTENQCLGVAEALGAAPIVKRIALRQPWKSLSPYLGFEQSWSFSPALKSESEPWPDLLIASGRKSIAAARYIKKMSAGKTFTVQIQDPRIDPSAFDLVAVPAHDPTRGDNVIVTTAAPNRITPARLEEARRQWAGPFEALNKPRVAVLIGGSSKAFEMTTAITHNLAAQLSALDASLMITTSRRTGAENEAILREVLCSNKKHALAGEGLFDDGGEIPAFAGMHKGQEGGDHLYFYDGKGENPYFGMLGWADIILVTADSASMLSEACTCGKPVYVIGLEPRGGKLHPRIDKLHQNLKQSGCLRDFTGRLEPFSCTPLNDAALIAEAIRKKMSI